jgi:hypothetical protein
MQDNVDSFDALTTALSQRERTAEPFVVHRQTLPFGDWQQKRMGLQVIRLLHQCATVFLSQATNPEMNLLTAVEYITPDPGRRVALYRGRHAEDHSIGAAKDLAFLERRAQAEGFQV